MLHIARDFITLPNIFLPEVTLYIEALFLRTCLQYTVIGNTGFNLDGGTFTLGTGTNGAISTGGGFTNRFTPDGYVVSSADLNRILVIRSTNTPMQTSGLWRVTGVDTTNNQFILGLRGSPPNVEGGLTWRLHPSESTLAFANGVNTQAAGTYRGRGATATTVRIIMQSPHNSQWQVRLTYETGTDVQSTQCIRTNATFAPGFGGDGIGDFPVGGNHLHGSLFFNSNSGNYTGLIVGVNPNTANSFVRYYLWGDDQTGSFVICTRNVEVTTGTGNNIGAFGLPEDEEYPNDPIPVRRLFAYGCTNLFNGGAGDINFRSGAAQQYGHSVVAMGYSGQPVMGAVSPYGYLSGQQSLGNGPRYSANGSDNPFLALTELQTVDLLAGMWDYGDFNGQSPALLLEPRRLGRFPIARLGRQNYGNFTTSTDGNRVWIHMLNGVYLPWYGSILP